MKKNSIYTGIFLMIGMALSACSNLDQSAFTPVVTEESLIYSETFADNLGKFQAVSVSGDQKWDYYSSGYATITGHVGSSDFANEDWLISPDIDLAKVTAAHLSFDYVARYFASVSTDATIWASENYVDGKNPSEATWVQIKTNPFTDPGSWTFANSGQISLTQFAGKKIRIAFKYVSTNAKAGTWEMKNFLVQKGEAVVDKALIYSETFSSGLGLFNAQSVSGDQVWAGASQGYALMSGYVSPSYFVNEDWLISPEIDLTGQTAANFSFDHVTRYFGTLSAEATVWISTNYVSGLPSTGTWTQVVTNPFTDPGAWTFSNSQAISLTAYVNKKIHIAFKYISTNTKAGSWEIKNFVVYSGEARGNSAMPYTVKQGLDAQTGALAWVSGYVVGYAWPGTNVPYVLSADTCSQLTNILIADTTTNVYASRVIAVQLPRGGIRNGLNLKSNKTLLGQKVKVKGTLTSYIGIGGMVNTTNFILANGTAGESTTTTIFTETFATSLGAFTKNSVKGTQVWAWSSGYGATMSGYSGSNLENEDWLISPVIDLTKYSSAAMSFDHTINKGVVANMVNDHSLWVSTDNGTTWKNVKITIYPAGNNWTFVNAGEISLDAYAGKQIQIAFKYLSTTSSAATWEIKNLLIYN